MVERAEAKQMNRAASSLLIPDPRFGILNRALYPNEDTPSISATIPVRTLTTHKFATLNYILSLLISPTLIIFIIVTINLVRWSG